jgi:hypothetical protein
MIVRPVGFNTTHYMLQNPRAPSDLPVGVVDNDEGVGQNPVEVLTEVYSRRFLAPIGSFECGPKTKSFVWTAYPSGQYGVLLTGEVHRPVRTVNTRSSSFHWQSRTLLNRRSLQYL